VWLLPLVVLPVLLLGGGYLHSIRHIVLRDVLRVAGLVAIGWLIGFLTLLWFETRGTSLTLAPAGFLFLAAYTVVPRILYKEYLRRKELNSKDFSELKKVIIFGTDDRAINLGSLIQRGFPTARLVGFLDNSSEVRGRTILDQKVVGSERDLPTLLSVHDFDQLWLSFSPDRIQRQRLESWTLENEVLLVILPEISAFESLFPNLSLTQEMKRPVALGDKIIDM
jgi:FlaA1/EpsC-like NDP-sugar epimerase